MNDDLSLPYTASSDHIRQVLIGTLQGEGWPWRWKTTCSGLAGGLKIFSMALDKLPNPPPEGPEYGHKEIYRLFHVSGFSLTLQLMFYRNAERSKAKKQSWQTSGLRKSAFKSVLKLHLSQSKISWLSLTLNKIPWLSRRKDFSLIFPAAGNPECYKDFFSRKPLSLTFAVVSPFAWAKQRDSYQAGHHVSDLIHLKKTRLQNILFNIRTRNIGINIFHSQFKGY